VFFAAASLSGAVFAQAKQPEKAPAPAGTPSQEVLAAWNEIGRKLVAMAEDFPEDKYWYQPAKEVRTFGGILLHVGAANYFFTNPIAGHEVGKATDDPPKEQFKTKGAVIEYLRKSFADGAAIIQQQGDAGLSKSFQHPFGGNRMVTAHAWWTEGAMHAAEHYGNLVTYYRLNNLVPPESRPRR
jgi:uncharacterized damage-inducible protein DinB